MAMYDVAEGYDNAGGAQALTITATKPPQFTGLVAGRRRVAGNRLTVEDGTQSGTLQWGYLTAAEFETLMEELFIDEETSAEITIILPNKFREATAYNCVVVAPDMATAAQFTLGKLVNVGIELMFIEEAA